MKGAVLLAAGRGTRMGALTADTPKPLLEVAGRPIIEHILDGLVRAGVERVVVVTGHCAERIEATLGGRPAPGRAGVLEIVYCRQERPEGTARALLLTEPLMRGAPFLLGWGDVLVEPGFYREFAEAFAQRPCDAQLAVNETEDPCAGAAVYVDDDWRVTGLIEKPPRGTSTTRWNNAGLFALTDVIFDYARRLIASSRGEYELPQALARMVEDGLGVRACPIHGYWCDVGTPADLARARRAFALCTGAL